MGSRHGDEGLLLIADLEGWWEGSGGVAVVSAVGDRGQA